MLVAYFFFSDQAALCTDYSSLCVYVWVMLKREYCTPCIILLLQFTGR